MISKFQLDPVKDIKAKFLSGGQRKRLSIAMSLLSDPKIILLDEYESRKATFAQMGELKYFKEINQILRIFP